VQDKRGAALDFRERRSGGWIERWFVFFRIQVPLTREVSHHRTRVALCLGACVGVELAIGRVPFGRGLSPWDVPTPTLYCPDCDCGRRCG
jgi:hypothetical protein